MQFKSEFLDALGHYGSFASSIVIHPGQPLVACSKSRSVTAIASIESGLDEIEDEVLPIFDLSSFNKVARLFSKYDKYNVDFKTTCLSFDAGKFSQDYQLQDATLLDGVAPKPEKVEAYMETDADVEFTLAADDLATFRAATSTNALSTIAFSSESGQVRMSCVDVDLAGRESRDSSVFRFDTGETTDKEFRIGFDRKNFVMLPGDYTVKLLPKNIRFIGEVVSYLLPVSSWSTMS